VAVSFWTVLFLFAGNFKHLPALLGSTAALSACAEKSFPFKGLERASNVRK
jgi:hypothetical protein